MNSHIRILGVALTLCFVVLFVQLNRLHTGARVVSSITEVTEVNWDRVQLNPIYARNYDNAGGDTPDLVATGSDPTFTGKLALHGVYL